MAKGEPADILDGTQKDTRKRHGEPEEEPKLKKIVTVMKSFRFTVAIDTQWPFHSESAAESTHYSGTPRQVNIAQKNQWGRGEWAAMQSSGGILYGREKYMEGR